MTIGEDFERLSELDLMYLYEREQEVWQEYQEWMDRQPAEINVIIEGQNEQVLQKASSLEA